MTPTQIRRQKATIILAQVFISMLMALSMTFVFGSLLPNQFHLPALWFGAWMRHFLAAWPVAFLFSLAIGPLAFALSGAIIARILPEPRP